MSLTLLYLLIEVVFCFFFFKQKTAYEMRISDWSSDVCSSDLFRQSPGEQVTFSPTAHLRTVCRSLPQAEGAAGCCGTGRRVGEEIGRASCRERVCQYV